ncbi:BolA/IbaG family iron-sulfur metabolism protein [Nitrosomonas sp.]|uniref:BolA family protein n=1 Tax=Nitrosomonas sp. TaxID=42353 RepID=UPI001D728D14|nr:BolA/IbaG family iron-sulfur metabolism protein [Nitrosomonas sp.]MBX9637975.1 BolA/IbaG family iron-sulfur metabolism protein [Nitrosomonas sp.]MBY0483891.1 BolA/IbaG family iron-sulfur metabolism protein [Nitrosomonas sp.]
MKIKNLIETKLRLLHPEFLEVVNESDKHNVPEGSESHFKVTIVSDAFHGKMLLARHRMVNGILADELAQSIHALVLHTLTMEEWFEKHGTRNDSPPCLGGAKSK